MKAISVNIGKKTLIQMKHKVVETGIFKKPVEDIFVDTEGVEGDTISDLKVHGGPEQAVYGYSLKHYDYWKEKYAIVKYDYGFFGENITFSDLEEKCIHIGSQYQCGEVILEVTKPRQPCFKLGLVFETNQIILDFWSTTKSGVYFKVIQSGIIKQGATFSLIHEAKENPTIAEVFISKRK
ncbi:MAG: MOSC domain-containing protein [Flavobacteriaceae bacterium]|nr:MOSC domain-containing protein [Flavobacteriaceae bacterium]